MINNVVLVGRLTKDPDLRYTANGQATANFTLAVNRSYKNANGQYDADFINVVIWRKPAETLAQYAKKGTLLGVTGRIQTRNYENQQGQRVYVTEVVCENFQLLESRASSERRQTTDQSFGGGEMNGGQSFNQSFNQSSTQASQNTMPDFSRDADPFASSAQIDISDDDLPF